MTSAVYAVILAGGSGSRFWPASRRARPKQLQSLGPGDGTLIEQAVQRMRPFCDGEHIVIATGEHLVEATRRVLPNLPAAAFLAEPRARNTAPCIGWATEYIARRDEEAIVVVLPSDQYVARPESFRGAMARAIEAARAGAVVTLGITPTRPETGYGYLHAGDLVAEGVMRLKDFREKPDEQTARSYVASGEYFWNAGIFVFQAGLMLDHFAACLPDTHAGLMTIREAAANGARAERAAVARFFDEVEPISIDFGVMEAIGRKGLVNMVAADVGWSDLGSFQTAWELASKDGEGNALVGDVLTTASHDNLVLDSSDDGSVIALVGVDDLVVVKTKDALLIARRQSCQDVKAIVEKLETIGRKELL